MPYRELREFLSDPEKQGELASIEKEVDTKFEISGYTLAAYARGQLKTEPALFFKNVKGHTIPVVTNLLGTHKRIAMAFNSTEERLFDDLLARYDRTIEPTKVSQGVCQEEVVSGDAVDLTKLPVMWWNEFDAGPYITAGCVITKDINTGRHNVGRYRLQLKGKNKLGILLSERQDVGRHYLIARDSGQKTMDVAIALGCDPVVESSSMIAIPSYVEEYTWAGGMKEPATPVELVSAKTVDLYVPATAEMVLEGKINIGEFESEGPLGEFTGYYSGVYENPVIHVNAITHRKNPIMLGHHMANMPGQNLLIAIVMNDVSLFKETKRVIPELTGLKTLSARYCLVAQVDKKRKYLGIARRVADAIWGSPHIRGSYHKVVIVVDNDVDINNPWQIFWALGVRSQPDEDVWVSGYCPGYGIDPSEKEVNIRSMGRVGVSRYTSRLFWDATESLLLSPDIKVIEPPPGYEKCMTSYDEVVRAGIRRAG